MLREVGGILGAIDPEMLARYRSEREDLDLAMVFEEKSKA